MAFREMALRRLQISIMAHEDEINRALRLDLGKSASEAYMCETGMVLAEISAPASAPDTPNMAVQ